MNTSCHESAHKGKMWRKIGSMIGIIFNMQVKIISTKFQVICWTLSINYKFPSANFQNPGIFFRLHEKNIIHAKTGSLGKSKLSLLDTAQ
jgi:hypothetical protein